MAPSNQNHFLNIDLYLLQKLNMYRIRDHHLQEKEERYCYRHWKMFVRVSSTMSEKYSSVYNYPEERLELSILIRLDKNA